MKIKDYIEKKKMSQKEFADMVGCSDGALSLWISEKRTPSPPMARVIVEKTKGRVSFSDLYSAEQPA